MGPMQKFFSSHFFRNLLWLLVAACLVASGGMACISGGGGVGGGEPNPLGGPNITSAVPPPAGDVTNQAAPTMPDIAVGPIADIHIDHNILKEPQKEPPY